MIPAGTYNHDGADLIDDTPLTPAQAAGLLAEVREHERRTAAARCRRLDWSDRGEAEDWQPIGRLQEAGIFLVLALEAVGVVWLIAGLLRGRL
jgi:hypothetical protein